MDEGVFKADGDVGEMMNDMIVDVLNEMGVKIAMLGRFTNGQKIGDGADVAATVVINATLTAAITSLAAQRMVSGRYENDADVGEEIVGLVKVNLHGCLERARDHVEDFNQKTPSTH